MAKSIKDRVKKLEKQSRLLTENIVDVIFVLDSKTLKYEYITSSIYRISGYTSKELINTRIIDRFTPESSNQVIEVLQTELTNYDDGTHDAQSLELELMHKNGGTYWVEIKAKLLKEPDALPKIVGIAKDITEKKKAEQQLEKQNIQLASALADKEKLLKEIKVLQKLLPICSGCKRIRDNDGKWWPLEIYVSEHTDSDFTHTICSDCKDIFYPKPKK